MCISKSRNCLFVETLYSATFFFLFLSSCRYGFFLQILKTRFLFLLKIEHEWLVLRVYNENLSFSDETVAFLFDLVVCRVSTCPWLSKWAQFLMKLAKLQSRLVSKFHWSIDFWRHGLSLLNLQNYDQTWLILSKNLNIFFLFLRKKSNYSHTLIAQTSAHYWYLYRSCLRWKFVLFGMRK